MHYCVFFLLCPDDDRSMAIETVRQDLMILLNL